MKAIGDDRRELGHLRPCWVLRGRSAGTGTSAWTRRRAAQHHHPIPQPHRLIDVVRHEQDREATLGDDPFEFGVQMIAGDRVERAERLYP